MEWKCREKKYGDERIVTRFLLLPTCLHEKYKWLEKAKILQMWHGMPIGWRNEWWAEGELLETWEYLRTR